MFQRLFGTVTSQNKDDNWRNINMQRLENQRCIAAFYLDAFGFKCIVCIYVSPQNRLVNFCP